MMHYIHARYENGRQIIVEEKSDLPEGTIRDQMRQKSLRLLELSQQLHESPPGQGLEESDYQI